jgi:N-acetylmuramic acid 6-phosphate etherase
MKGMLGIEGGGTKTEWLYRAESETDRGGTLPAGTNLRLVSDEALERVFRAIPVATDAVNAVGVFLAGCATEADRVRLRRLAAAVWPGARMRVGSDRESGFASAFGVGDGVAVIAGTGSAVTGRRAEQTEKAGGWGQLLGDKGSGYDLALQALRQVLWRYDVTREIAPVAQRMLARLGLNRLEELALWATEAEKMAVARLAPVVFVAAHEGDEAMRAIVTDGARALAEAAAVVAKRLDMEHPVVKLQGGLLLNHPEYAKLVAVLMRERLPGAAVSVCRESGALGALWLAGGVGQREEEEPQESTVVGGDLAAALTEQVNPHSTGWESLDVLELVDLFIAEEVRVREALHRARLELAAGVELVLDALKQGGRLFYVGAGTSGRLGLLDASEIPPTFGLEPERVQAIMAGGVTALVQAVEGAEDAPEAGALAVTERGVQPGDVVCGIAASGRTPFVIGALRKARALGGRTMLIACNPVRQRQEPGWDVEIDLDVGPELLAGSTRLKAGTATKIALNILSTAAMVRLGRTRGNLMAGMRVSNRKLRERAIRMVAAVRGVSRPEAAAALEAAGWEVRRCLEQ